MLRKLYLVPAILSVACFLTLTDVAQAQRRGGGGGNRGGNNGAWRGGNYNGYRGGNYNNNHGYYHNDWYSGFGVYINPSFGYRYGSPYRYYDSYYSTPSYYYTPETEYAQPLPTTVYSDTAHIRVMLPDPAARVWFDGALTSQRGTDRTFTTPSLTSSGTYRIRAAWMQGGTEVAAERVVTVAAGQSVMVDFTRQ